jgi:hypothetical protein
MHLLASQKEPLSIIRKRPDRFHRGASRTGFCGNLSGLEEGERKEVQALGLKKKSEYKAPVRKAKAA